MICHHSFVRHVHYMDNEMLKSQLKMFKTSKDEATRLSILTSHVVPQRDIVSTALSSIDGCFMLAMQLRDDIAKVITTRPTTITLSALRDTDVILREWLRTAFNVDCLSIKRITYDGSSGLILENIARGESGIILLLFFCTSTSNPIVISTSFRYNPHPYPNPFVIVHAVRSLSELKRRLDYNGRHCYALFHLSLPNEPLAFIHVSFTSEAMAHSMQCIRNSSGFGNPNFANFYSVNALKPALGKQYHVYNSNEFKSLLTNPSFCLISICRRIGPTKTSDPSRCQSYQTAISFHSYQRDIIPHTQFTSLAHDYLVTCTS